MKATIHDTALLRSLGPLDVAAYLRSNGWQEVERIADRAVVWHPPPSSGEDCEILLPLRSDLGDFVPRMAEALRAFEVTEQRSQLEILRDLTSQTADVIRIHAQQPEAQDGTLPLDDGLELVQNAREMLLAAACAAVQPRPYFSARKPAEAAAYIEKVRLGQTERGSYIITLLSRVPPSLEPGKGGQTGLDVEDPFERRATRTLARALEAIREAAQQAIIAGDSSFVHWAVAHGVSANLCDAVVALAGGSAAARDVEVSFTWSPLRPPTTSEPRRVLISADAIPLIEEVGRVFRESAPREAFELVGFVVGRHRDEGAADGKVWVTGVVDGTWRTVHLDLTDPEYSWAVEAYERRQVVTCEGELIREGRSFSLRNPQNFWIESDS